MTHSFADQTIERGYKYISQVTPRELTFGKLQSDGALTLAKSAGEAVTKVSICKRIPPMARQRRTEAKAAGVEVVIDEGYPLSITEISPLIKNVRLQFAGRRRRRRVHHHDVHVAKTCCHLHALLTAVT